MHKLPIIFRRMTPQAKVLKMTDFSIINRWKNPIRQIDNSWDFNFRPSSLVEVKQSPVIL